MRKELRELIKLFRTLHPTVLTVHLPDGASICAEFDSDDDNFDDDFDPDPEKEPIPEEQEEPLKLVATG